MRFRILGPVRVRVGGDWLPVRADQPRLVLAVLLAEGGRTVSTERLVDALWGERQPRTAVNTVQAYVMRLRRMFGDGVLVTQGHGYQLLVGGVQTDAGLFEWLVTRARRELNAGRAEAATVRLRTALALWHGPVFADVADHPALIARASELDRLRTVASEDRIRGLVNLGLHAEAVDELHRLVADHPLGEHLWAMLMQALDSCGRRAEALAIYQRARRVLRDELGLEPGPRLREVQRRILAEPA